MIKKINLYKFLLVVIFFISFFSYEINLYKYYSIFQFILSGLFIFLLLFVTKYESDVLCELKKNIGKNKWILILFYLMLLNTCVGVFFGYTSLLAIVKVMMFFVSVLSIFFMLPSLLKKYDGLYNYIKNIIIFFCFILSIIAILIKFNGSFLCYSYSYRVSGIYSDPNFFAMVLAVSFLLILNQINNNKKLLILLLLNAYAIYVTGSRGTILGIVISLLVYIIKVNKDKKIKQYFIIGIYVLMLFFAFNYLNSINFFRESQGSNGRLEMIISALDGLKKSPIFGYGYSGIENYLHLKGFNNASTHNSLIDYLFAYGLVPFVIYVYSYLKNLYLSYRYENNIEITILLIFMLFNMNTILYNLGGVGISSLLLTIFWGYSNYKLKDVKDI